VEKDPLAGSKKNAKRKGQTIVFIDESGLSLKPHRCRTWSPRGQTPVLQYHFNWKDLSAIAGVTWWTFYFRLYPSTIRSPQVVDFLRRLLRQIPGNILVIWDGLRQHRSRLVKDYVAAQDGRLTLEYLPAYAPELNPVEYIWGYWKRHELPNFCPRDFSPRAPRTTEHAAPIDSGPFVLGASATVLTVTMLRKTQ
jgi:transposase